MARPISSRELDQKIIELVAWARERYEIPEGCPGQDACRALGFRLECGSLPPGTDGLITKNKVVIINDGIFWAPRIEFTIYHELLHYLLDEHGDLIELMTNALRNSPAAYRDAIERCCHAGAAEFLAPRQRVHELISDNGFSVDLIQQLSERHRTSIVASTIQLATCAPVDCYVVVCSPSVVPRTLPHMQTLYVEQAAMRPEMRYPWARFTPIPRDHLFHQVWESKHALAGPSYVQFRSGSRMDCEHGEAKPLGERVIGILYRGHPPRKGQLGLGI